MLLGDVGSWVGVVMMGKVDVDNSCLFARICEVCRARECRLCGPATKVSTELNIFIGISL